MSATWEAILKLMGAQESDFITPNEKSMIKPIDFDAFNAIFESIFKQEGYSFRITQFEQNLSEAISLLDRCVDNRKRAIDLQNAHFQALLRYYLHKRIGIETLKEIEAGLFGIGEAISNKEHEMLVQRKTVLESLLPAPDVRDIDVGKVSSGPGIDVGKVSSDRDIDVAKIRSELFDIEAKITAFEKQKVLDAVRTLTQDARHKIRNDMEDAIYNRMMVPGSCGNYMQRYDIVKRNFDIDLAGAYFRLISVAKGVKIIGITPGVLGVNSLPEIKSDTVGFLDSLNGWTRNLLIAMQQRLVDDQNIVIRLSLRNDCRNADGEAIVWADYASSTFKFTVPDSLFRGLKFIRMRGLTVGSREHAWRIKIEPPSFEGDDYDRSVYLGRVLPFDGMGKGTKEQVFRGNALHNLDPTKGVWKLDIVGNYLDGDKGENFSPGTEKDFYLDLHLSAIVVED